jgi:hypothetical protein
LTDVSTVNFLIPETFDDLNLPRFDAKEDDDLEVMEIKDVVKVSFEDFLNDL